MRKLMKTIMIIVTVSFFLFRVTQISEATIIPINNINVPYKSISVGRGYETIWSMDIPDGMMVSTINISISSDVFGDHYMPHFRVLVDGNVVEECQAPKDIRTILLTGLNGKNNVVFQGSYTHAYYTTIYIEGGSIGFDINLADEEARDAALDAKNSADAAKTAAENANANAWQAAVKAQEAAHYANHYGYWSTGYLDGSLNSGKSLAATYDRAGEASQNTTYIRNTQLPDIENMIASLQSDVTNIKTNLSASDTTPPYIKSVKGYRNATCTTESTFKLVIEASDNNSGVEFRAKADTGSWTSWISNNPITVSGITGTGAHVIDVEVRDSSGNVTTGNMTVFKI